MVFAAGSTHSVSRAGSIPSRTPRTNSSMLSKAVSSRSRLSIPVGYPTTTRLQPVSVVVVAGALELLDLFGGGLLECDVPGLRLVLRRCRHVATLPGSSRQDRL